MIVMLASTLLATSPLAAQDPEAPAKEKLICRSEHTVGTHFRRRTCKTLAEWRAVDDDNQSEKRRMMDNSGNREGRFIDTPYAKPL